MALAYTYTYRIEGFSTYAFFGAHGWLTMVMGGSGEIESIQTSMLRALASTHRLRIIHLLGCSSVEVRDIAKGLGVSQATASQHLAAMRAVGLVEATRDGRVVRYRLTDPEILAACDLMRDVLVRRLSLLGDLAAAAQSIEPAIPLSQGTHS